MYSKSHSTHINVKLHTIVQAEGIANGGKKTKPSVRVYFTQIFFFFNKSAGPLQ